MFEPTSAVCVPRDSYFDAGDFPLFKTGHGDGHLVYANGQFSHQERPLMLVTAERLKPVDGLSTRTAAPARAAYERLRAD